MKAFWARGFGGSCWRRHLVAERNLSRNTFEASYRDNL